MTRQLTVAILAATLVAAAACGKSAEQKQAEETAKAIAEASKTGAEQMVAGAAAMAKGFEQFAKTAATGEVVPFETLGAAFPQINGWKRDDIKGSTTNFPMKMSESKTYYRDGDKRIRVEIMDAALAQMMLLPISAFLAANFSERSSDGYKKGISVKGEPGFEEVDTKNETAELTVVVAKRFIVSAHGNRGTSIDNVRAVVEQMDFGKLK